MKVQHSLCVALAVLVLLGLATAVPAPPTTSTNGPEDGDAVAVTTPAAPAPDEDDCSDQFEYYNNDALLERLKQYDVAAVLEGLGGAPGKVNATWSHDVPVLVANTTERPLPDTNDTAFWLYDYRASDYATFVRLEHALARGEGAVDVRGEVWWTPAELCGAMRHALYRQDQDGFRAEVLRAHCHIFRKSQSLSCYGPDSENECAFCISGVSGALIASLVG